MESVTFTEATRRLGISRRKVWALVRDGELQMYADPLDERRRLISQQAIENLLAKHGADLAANHGSRRSWHSERRGRGLARGQLASVLTLDASGSEMTKRG